jgi:hypothetical protein
MKKPTLPRFRGPRRLPTVLAAGASTLVIAAIVLANAAVSVASTTVTIKAVANGYADSTAPSTIYGAAAQLRVDGSPTVYSFVRFDLSSVTGTITSAKLHLYANSADATGYDVALAGGGWTESGLAWTNSPTFSAAPLGGTGPFAAATTTEVDVTAGVRGGSVADFAIIDRDATAVSFGSRLSANPPVLVLTLGSSPSGAISSIHPTAVPTANASPSLAPVATKAPNATAAPASDPVLIGAGDICVTSIIGQATATAKLVEARPTAHVFTLGDNSNESGTASQYTGCYAKTWGPFLDRTHAVIGNHDCMTGSNCAPYYSYFGATAGPSGKGYYSYDLANNWHVIVLNTQGTQIGGTGTGTAEETWLRADLAASAGKHIIAMWHIPVFTSGLLSRTAYNVWWQDLYAAHADLVLDGHDHLYERFALQSPTGKADPNGIREIIVGTGGAPPQPFGSKIAANSQVRHAGTFGVLELTLRAHSYSWQFLPAAGGTFTDSGTQATHS